MALRVVVAEDSLLMREGICLVINRQDDLEVVAECGDRVSLTSSLRARALSRATGYMTTRVS